MRMLRSIAVAAALSLLGLEVVPATAYAADYPTSSFYVSYGNSFIKGKVTWYSLSVGISYTIKSVTGCKVMFAEAYDPRRSGSNVGVINCEGQGSEDDHVTIDGASPGGYSIAEVFLVDGGTGEILGGDLCERDFTYCIDDDF